MSDSKNLDALKNAPAQKSDAFRRLAVELINAPTGDGFIHRETTLAGQLHLHPATLRELREKILVKDVDWAIQKKCAFWTTAAVAKMAAALTPADPAPVPANAPPTPSATPAQPEKKAAVTTLIVHKTGFTNRAILQAYQPGKKNSILTVRVRDSALFAPGVKITAQHVQGKHFVLAGPPPRRRGQSMRTAK